MLHVFATKCKMYHLLKSCFLLTVSGLTSHLQGCTRRNVLQGVSVHFDITAGPGYRYNGLDISTREGSKTQLLCRLTPDNGLLLYYWIYIVDAVTFTQQLDEVELI